VSVNIFEQTPMQQLLASQSQSSERKSEENNFQKLLPLNM